MKAQFDLDVLPINRRGGFDQSQLPGLHVAVPPRRAARGRAGDLLILLLTLKGNAPFASQQLTGTLESVAKTYYQTSGSVTAAMRAAAEGLNQSLLDRNLQSSSGLQSIGVLTLVVAHGDRLYVAQSGPTHAFAVSDEGVRHLHEPQIAGRGLGISRTTTLRFSQALIGGRPGLLLLTPDPPTGWTETTLAGTHKLKLESAYPMLLQQAGDDLRAVVIFTQPGDGALHLLQRLPPESAPPQEKAAPPEPAETEQAPPAPEPSPLPVADPEPMPSLGTTTGAIPETAAPPPPSQPVAEPPQPVVSSDATERAPGARAVEERTPARSLSLPSIGPAVLAVGRALEGAWNSATHQLRTLLGRMLPGEGLFTIPSTVMALIAISVPLVVVTAASVVYFERGQALQHQAYFEQARQAAEEAVVLEDPIEQRQAWETTLFYLDQAEEYRPSQESQALRNLAQQSLDNLNGVTRLSFQPAVVTGLQEDLQISRMAATADDLYMLDSTSGTVTRAILTGLGYKIDPTFRCGPGAYGAYLVGPLIDIAPLPQGNDLNATLLAMDANGNLLYCLPGESPLSTPLVPPDSNWGRPTAFALDSGNMHVLDPQTNAVWLYRGEDGSFPERPRLFFSEQIPPMQEVIDLAVNRQDLYLLHADGHLTTCSFSNLPESPTRCNEPALITDPRPGREDGPIIPDALFTEIQFSPPPDPSIYLLDPTTQAIYHFSLRLTLQRQYRPQMDDRAPEESATAFAVSPNRTVFLAFGRQVFYANLQ